MSEPAHNSSGSDVDNSEEQLRLFARQSPAPDPYYDDTNSDATNGKKTTEMSYLVPPLFERSEGEDDGVNAASLTLRFRMMRKYHSLNKSQLLLVTCAGVFAIVVLFFSFSASVSLESCSTARNYTKHAAEFLARMDTSIDPCDNFTGYAYGRGLEALVLQPHEMQNSLVFSTARAAVTERVKSIIAAGWPYVSTLHSSCMDEAAIDARGYAPISGAIIRLSTASSVDRLLQTTAQLRLSTGLDLELFFSVNVEPDAKQPSRTLVAVAQRGFNLPEKSYYTNSTLLTLYTNWIVQAFAAVRVPLSAAEAAEIVALESTLAAVSLGPEEQTDPWVRYNLRLPSQLPAALGIASVGVLEVLRLLNTTATPILVAQPTYFLALQNVLNQTQISTLRNFGLLSLFLETFSLLGAPFQELMLGYAQLLSDVRTLDSRESRCTASVESLLGMLVSQYYVEHYFSAAAQNATADMFEELRQAHLRRIADSDWMDTLTATAATQKFTKLEAMIGAPAKWPELDRMLRAVNAAPLGLQYFENVGALRRAYDAEALSALGQPVDRGLWDMFPFEVNAYYSPESNRIVIPAGIIQEPFFFLDGAPDAVNYCGLGAVQSHELSHVDDPYGSLFDADGRLFNWWSPSARAEFEARTQCIADQFSQFEVAPGHFLNGKLVLGEAVADLNGLVQAYSALLMHRSRDSSAAADEDKRTQDLYDGLSWEQLCFITYAQTWATKARSGYEVRLSKTDPHPIARFRVEGTLQNMPSFAAAFDCPRGSRYNPEEQCQLQKKKKKR